MSDPVAPPELGLPPVFPGTRGNAIPKTEALEQMPVVENTEPENPNVGGEQLEAVKESHHQSVAED